MKRSSDPDEVLLPTPGTRTPGKLGGSAESDMMSLMPAIVGAGLVLCVFCSLFLWFLTKPKSSRGFGRGAQRLRATSYPDDDEYGDEYDEDEDYPEVGEGYDEPRRSRRAVKVIRKPRAPRGRR